MRLPNRLTSRYLLLVLPLLAAPVVAPLGCGSNAEMVQPTAGAGGGGAGGGGEGGTPTAGAGGTSGAGGGGVDDGGVGGGPGPNEPEVQATVCPVFPSIPLTGSTTDAEQPAIMWTGKNYLVVWSSAAAGTSATKGDIHVTLLNEVGTRVGTDIVIPSPDAQATSPELAAVPNTEDFVVIWETCVGGGNCPGGSGVQSVVLGPDGMPKGAPVALAPPAAVQRRPYVAAGLGNVYAAYRDVVMTADPAKPKKTVARVHKLSADGAKDGEGIIVDEMSDGHYPHVALGPDRVALVYQRNNPTPDIVLALFDVNLALQKEVVLRRGLPSDATNPVVQWNTSRWVVAWEDQRGGEDEAQIYATVVDADGSRVGPVGCSGPTCDPEAAYEANGNWPTIASGDLNTSLIGFYGYPGQRVFLARVEANGNLKPGQVVLGTGKFPSVTYNKDATGGGQYAVVYEDPGRRVIFARFKCSN